MQLMERTLICLPEITATAVPQQHIVACSRLRNVRVSQISRLLLEIRVQSTSNSIEAMPVAKVLDAGET